MGDTTSENPENPVPISSGDTGPSEKPNATATTVSESVEKEAGVAFVAESSKIMKPKTNDDVQRAIEGLKDIPDEELQEFLDDEDFMEGLDVVDAWEGEEEKRPDKRAKSKDKERKRTSRDRNRWRDHRSPNNREKLRREDRKKEETRRDPSKSTKDIERDKIRTQRDSESKILAEKKKAIKSLLDSDNVVPPGTEMEAIETIAEKQNVEKQNAEKQNVEKLGSSRSRKSRERRKSADRNRGSPNRRRSGERSRRSPHRRWSPIVMSPDRRRSPVKSSPGSRRSPLRLSPSSRRSPFRISPAITSPEKRRSLLRLSPNHPRRSSRERRTSAEERRRSAERHRRRNEANDRDHRPYSRRSRSRDRHRSRSVDRRRRRYSRSPPDRRGSPRWRSRSGSRGRSPQRRARRRSPFINEIRRQFRNEGNQQPPPLLGNIGYMIPPSMGGMPPMVPQIYPHDPERPPYMPPHHPGPQGMMMPGPPQGFMNFDPHHPHMPPSMGYDPSTPQPLMQSEFASGPVMYNQQNPAPVPPLMPLPVPSPQPVPAPGPLMEQGSIIYNQTHGVPLLPTPAGLQPINVANRRSNTPQARSVRSNTPRNYKEERRSSTPYNGTQHQAPREERLRTPEPPVISNSKATFGKTSLSSLLEASVSAKDSVGPPVLYPGFKPEILRHCEHALRDLPIEDPRLKMKGRFFFNPKKEDASSLSKERSSNSILLRKGKNKIYWDEEEERHSQITVKSSVNVHQKICQTDEVQTEHRHVQATVTTADFGVQVYPYDLQQPTKEEKRPIMDRLDWNMRETFDYAPKPREADDLRWSLSNSSQKRPWGRAVSPTTREPEPRELSRERLSSSDYATRTLTVCTPTRNRDEYSSHRGSGSRDHFVRDSITPNYRQGLEDHQDHFRDNRSDRSRGESPMVLDDSPDEIEEETEVFPRVTERLVFPKLPRGQSIPSFKGRGGSRGGRPYSGGRGGGGGGFRGKF